MTKDALLKSFIETNREIAKATQQMALSQEAIKENLRTLNDNNVFHTSVLKDNTEAIKGLAKHNQAVIGLLKWVLVAVVSALVVIAGAEKGLIPHF